MDFINPFVTEMTRTVKVRVSVANEGERLKPGMYIHAEARSAVDKGEPVLAIPATAPLLTGKRAVVYVAEKTDDQTRYVGRDVDLGPRAGDFFVVDSGLSAGDRVVTRGAFKIDAALQIRSEPSMMSELAGTAPAGPGTMPGMNMPMPAATAPSPGPAEMSAVPMESTAPSSMPGMVMPDATMESTAASTSGTTGQAATPEALRAQLAPFVSAYLDIQSSLSTDNAATAKVAAAKAAKALGGVDMTLLAGSAHMEWMRLSKDASGALAKIAATADIEQMRAAFGSLSTDVIGVVKAFGPIGPRPLYAFHCPMAFSNKGADWVQAKKEGRNPYFGKMMPTCGGLTGTLQEGSK